jgi:hypothetical protein
MSKQLPTQLPKSLAAFPSVDAILPLSVPKEAADGQKRPATESEAVGGTKQNKQENKKKKVEVEKTEEQEKKEGEVEGENMTIAQKLKAKFKKASK